MSDDANSLRSDARRNYERLLAAADTIFSLQGAAASLDAIAKQAGVGIGTLYRHFPTRKSLLEALYADKLAALGNKATTLLSTVAPDKALVSWLKTIIEYSVQYGGFRNLLTLLEKDEHSVLATAGENLLKKAQRSGIFRSDVTILDLLQLVNGIIGDTSPEELERTDKLLSIIMAGIRR